MPDISQYDPIFQAAGAEWNVDPTLLKALTMHESGGNPNARGRDGEVGLAQFMPVTAAQIGVTNRADPEQAIWGMAKYMNQALTAEHDNPTAALRYYNGGPGWRNANTDPKYPSYVAGQYQRFAKADTGTMTDATPAPAPAADYNTPPAAPASVQANAAPASSPPPAASTGAGNATSGDDPYSQRVGGGGGTAKPGGGTEAAPADDPYTQRVSRGGAGDGKGETKAAPPPPVPATSVGAVDEYGRSQEPISQADAAKPLPSLGDVTTAIQTSLGNARTAIQSGDINLLKQLAPGPDAGPVEYYARKVAATGVHAAASLADIPLSILMAGAGPAGLTINPKTGTLNLTPEALNAAQMGAGGLRFSGPHPLEFVPPSGTFDPKAPIPAATAANLIDPAVAARIAAAKGEPIPIPAAPPQAGPPSSGSWRPAQPGEVFQPGQSYRMNQTTGQAEVFETAPATGPASQTGVPPTPPKVAAPTGGGAVGANVTTGPLPPKTMAQRIADLEKSVQQTAEDRAGPSQVDNNAYVPGIPTRTLGARDFAHSVNALDEKRAKVDDDAFRDDLETNERDRNQGMVDLLRNDAGDGNTMQAAKDARSQYSPDALNVFENEKPTDAGAMVTAIDKVLDGPTGKRTKVAAQLQKVRDSLFDKDGNLETMPSRLYGARQNLTDLLDTGGAGDLADAVRASKTTLEGLLPVFDKTITNGAPKFDQFLKKWHELSLPIDQQTFLQQYHSGPKRVDSGPGGYLQPEKVQKMLDDVLQGHRQRGPNNAKSLTDEQISNIVAVRNEVAADQLKARKAKTPGSDTFQLLRRPGVLGRGYTGVAVKTLGELAMGIPSLGVANYMYHRGIKPSWDLARENRIKAAEQVRKRELLAPPTNYLNEP